jgi:hypothetical protein
VSADARAAARGAAGAAVPAAAVARAHVHVCTCTSCSAPGAGSVTRTHYEINLDQRILDPEICMHVFMHVLQRKSSRIEGAPSLVKFL